MITTGSTNLYKRKLIRNLEKLSKSTGQSIWKRVAEELAKPRRRRIATNLSKINRHSADGEIIVVPGKVLGAGKLLKKVTIIAESFSVNALEKIKESGSEAISFYQIMEDSSLLTKVKEQPKKIIV